jgi:glutaredoxin 3
MIFMVVKVYSTNFCPYCNMAKNFLKDKNVQFEEINVQEDKNAAKEMIEKTGQVGVPVIEINGKTVIGFDRDQIEKLLNTK